ncbi:hypothetical protein AGMMS49921_08410 [Endomicrobiia bacterium]|nr:hypothetical protein AGMMS49921_08410 [Endomicrobiia bacterium]
MRYSKRAYKEKTIFYLLHNGHGRSSVQLLDFGNSDADIDAFHIQYVGKGNKDTQG